MKKLILCFLLFASSAYAADKPPAASLSKPNILFIAIDDFNDWGPSQLEGEPFDVDTPNFDSLADQAIIFRNAHCNAPPATRPPPLCRVSIQRRRAFMVTVMTGWRMNDSMTFSCYLNISRSMATLRWEAG